MSPRRPLRLRIVWPILIAWVALAAHLLPTPRTIDDAFITFRYSRNLAGGLGFVYNPGERVLGTTTPLYTLLLAALAGTTGTSDYPHLAWLVNGLADTLTCLLLIRAGTRLTGRRGVGLMAAALWAVAPMSVTFAVGGMETSVVILLLVLSAALYLDGRTGWAAAASALLLLARPDGIVFVGLLLADVAWQAWRRRRLPWREAAVFLLVLAPWGLFATWYFGSPVPHSILAKSLAYRLESGSALVRLIQQYSTPFFEDPVLGAWWRLAGLFVYFGLCLLGALAVLRRLPQAWPLALYPWLYLVVFAAPNPLIFRWYLLPPLPFYILFILAGVSKIADDVKAGGANIHQPLLRRASLSAAAGLLPVVFGLFLCLSLNEWTLQPDHGPQAPAPQMAWHKLELLYTAVAQQLVSEHLAGSQTLIAAGDVGALGYYTQARILDTVGLMSPQASAYYPLDPALYTISYAVAPRLILDYRPDFVILLEVYGRKGLFLDPTFLAEYTLYSNIPTDIYGSTGLLVYRRR
jgi:hypothetical protein